MSVADVRREVMKTMEANVGDFLAKYIQPIDKIWQPSDFLPDPEQPGFIEKIEELRANCATLPYDFWIILIGDTITEEALPTYESWLMGLDGVDQYEGDGWSKWIRAWTAEENRHGDLLNKFLYLSGRVNMREIEVTTQYLISEGFDIGTSSDPYKNFVYTSFQELATNISHRRVAMLARQYGNKMLTQINGIIAADEMRHHKAYCEFVTRIFEFDPNEMMIAFAYMMKRKIVMPAHLIRETGENEMNKVGNTMVFEHFSNAAQRLGVYTSADYIEITDKLNKIWKIDEITGLNEQAEKARDYLMNLPARLTRIAERITVPDFEYKFSWVR